VRLQRTLELEGFRPTRESMVQYSNSLKIMTTFILRTDEQIRAYSVNGSLQCARPSASTISSETWNSMHTAFIAVMPDSHGPTRRNRTGASGRAVKI